MQLYRAAVDPKLRSDFLSKIPGVQRQQLRRRQFDRGPRAEHRRLPVQPDRPQRPRPVHIPARLRDDRPAPVRRGLRLFQRDRRPDRSGLHQPRPAAGLHEFRCEAHSLAWRWMAGRASRTRCAAARTWRRCSSTATGCISGNQYTRRSASSIRSAETVPAIGFQPQGRYTNTYQIGDSASLMLGEHSLQMGGSWQRNHVNPYNFAGAYPQVNFGFSSAAPVGVQLTRRSSRAASAPRSSRTPTRSPAGSGASSRRSRRLPGPESELGVRWRHRGERELHAGQHRRLPAGQLALEIELHYPRRPEVGVLQPAQRGQQPRVPAGDEQPAA